MTEKEERDKAFYEISGRYTTTMNAMQRLIHTERSTLISKQKLELVLAELSAMPEDVPTYKQIGKAYFLETKSGIMSEGKAEIKASISELEIVRQNKSAVETKLKEIQAELKEFQQ